MMRSMLVTGVVLGWVMSPGAVFAQNPQEILKKLDDAEFGAKDTVAEVRMILEEKNGKTSERKMKMFQKGSTKRLIRFLSPADVKGIAFLDEGKDKMYVYMPAFHKIRRIAGHVKNENFAGTDFAHDDLSTERFSDRLEATALDEEGDHYVLVAKDKKEEDSQWSKLKMWVRKKDFLFSKLEYYDKSGTKAKVFTRGDFRLAGKYMQSFAAEMTDLKSGHKTKMIVESIECDTGLKDRMFSKRQLKRH